MDEKTNKLIATLGELRSKGELNLRKTTRMCKACLVITVRSNNKTHTYTITAEDAYSMESAIIRLLERVKFEETSIYAFNNTIY